MVVQMKNGKSLTFYQMPEKGERGNIPSAYAGGLGASAVSAAVYQTAGTTMQYNSQLQNYLNVFHAQRERISQKVANGLANNPDYTGARSDAVSLAWKYEQADVEMGGKGSVNWDAKQRQELKKTGKIKNAEGHHGKNVADYPVDQGNPDNIRFYKSREEHLQKGHKGDFRNESDLPYIDKDKMLKKTNGRRVFKNEALGIGAAAVIGAGIGMTLGFAISLAQSGVTPESLKYALAEGKRAGVSSGFQSVIGYGIGRTFGQAAASGLEGILSNAGMSITENISKMCNMGVVGAITITVFSAYQFAKLRHDGMATKEAAVQVGKQAFFSLSLLAVAIAAQGIWGGAAGLVVSISTGIIFITYSIADIVHQRHYSQFIREYMIDKCKPSFI